MVAAVNATSIAMFSATNLCPQHLRKGKTVDQHQDDDGRYRHANHADAEDNLRDGLVAGEIFQRIGECRRIAFDEHCGELLIHLRKGVETRVFVLWAEGAKSLGTNFSL